MANKKILLFFCLFVAGLLITASFSSMQTGNYNEQSEDYEYTVIQTTDQGKVKELGYKVAEVYDSFILAKVPVKEDSQFLKLNNMNVIEREDNLNKIHLRSGTINSGNLNSIEQSLMSNQESYYLVKAIGPIKPEWKSTIKEYGTIADYVPENTYVVKLSQPSADSLSDKEFIKNVGNYKSNYKISPELTDASGKTQVTINTFEDSEGLLPKLSPYGDLIKYSEDTVQLETYGSYINDMAKINGISYIEPSINLKLLNTDAQWTVQTGTSGDRSIWNHGLTGEGQVVGISDTGLDYDHSAFRDPEGDPIGSNHRKVVRYVAYADDHDLDSSGHGTHTSGSIAGNDEPFGSSTHDGMAKNAKLSFYDIGGSSDSLDIPSDYSDIFTPAYDDGARIHSNSWGGSDSSYTSGAKDVDEFMWNNKDMLIFFANGNSGDSSNTIGTPATAKNIVSVGASGDGNEDVSMNDIASFSSRGPTDDGRMKPTIVAPGDGNSQYSSDNDIQSADSDGDLSTNNNGYTGMHGTSMACPIAAGSATLIREYFVDGHYPGGTISSPSAALIKSVLVNGAVEISGDGAYTNDNSFPNNDQGWGRVNLENALEFSDDSRSLKVVDETNGISTGTTKTYTVNVADTSEPLEVTMAYTDYPGSTSASKALVNDLNLKVTAPDGSVYKGNVFSGYNPGQSTTGGDYDALNPLENVLRLNPQSGEYTVEVIAENVPQGPQPFALSITGGLGDSGAPSADYDYSPTNPEAGETIQFTDQSSDSDGSVESWEWDFGDGTTSTSQNPTHSYSTGGTFTVKLTVTDNDGLTDSVSKDISVTGNQAPSASFSYSPTNPVVSESIQFSDESSDSDGSISSWSWNFGDGSSSTSQNPTHSYSSSGTYTVELTVTDDEGATDTTTKDVTVEEKQYSQVSGGDTSYDEYITNVQFNGINRDSGDNGGYADHTDSVTNSLTPGSTYTLSVTMSTGGYTEYATVVIDWDQDYDLSNDQVIEIGSGSSDPLTVSTDITVPSDAVTGQTRMRVMQEYNSYHKDPTSNQDYGETEDYTVSVDTGSSNEKPSASFSYSPTDPITGESIQFTDESTDSDGSISSWSWSFGDSASSTSQNPTHSYSSSGTYTVELTVTDDDGATDTTTKDVSVTSSNTAPTASFSYSPTSPTTGETIQFTDESSDSDGSISSWSWNFGDGATSTSQDPTHSYSSSGTYTVELTVTDDDGATDTTTQDISVSSTNSDPTASFSYSPTSPTTGETIQFTDESSDSDGSISSWSWNFGDGSSSTSQNPTHSYSSSGTYTVELTVTDDDGATDTTTSDITVDGGQYSQVSGGDTSYNEYMTNVQFNGINRDSGDDGGYADHTDSVSNTLTPGSTYTLSVTMSTGGYSEYATVVIDWDHDYDLSDNQVIKIGYGNSDPLTVTKDITVPSDAVIGQTRMRVMQEYSEYHTDPTANQNYGETEDYTVSIGDGSSNDEPTASFTYSPTDPEPGETIQFTDGSSDSDGSISSWSWNFGDGSTSTSQSPTHSYSSEGTYTVKLTVTDNEGATNTATKDVSVATSGMTKIIDQDFEGDTSGWTSGGLWHLVDESETYGDSHSTSTSVWYGQDSTGDYDTGSQTTGSLAVPTLDLSGATQAELSFYHWFETESYSGEYDQVKVTVNGNQVYYRDSSNSNVGSENNFVQETIDISSYIGSSVNIEFTFDSMDGSYNSYRGWYVDDVVVQADSGSIASVTTSSTSDNLDTSINEVSGVISSDTNVNHEFISNHLEPTCTNVAPTVTSKKIL